MGHGHPAPKAERLAVLLAGCPACAHAHHDGRYLGYFACFNREEYYEAHDVLESLWLERRPVEPAIDAFYKGLIQFAGAYVHLQKGRLKPADNLFALALKNLGPYPAGFQGAPLGVIRGLAEATRLELQAGAFRRNPFTAGLGPRLPWPAT